LQLNGCTLVLTLLTFNKGESFKITLKFQAFPTVLNTVVVCGQSIGDSLYAFHALFCGRGLDRTPDEGQPTRGIRSAVYIALNFMLAPCALFPWAVLNKSCLAARCCFCRFCCYFCCIIYLHENSNSNADWNWRNHRTEAAFWPEARKGGGGSILRARWD